MRFQPPRTLDELASYAEKVIADRLAELGSPDIAPKIEVVGDPQTTVSSLRPVENAEAGCLTFAVGEKYLHQASNSPAAALIVPPHLDTGGKPGLKAPEPRLCFTVLMELASGPSGPSPGLPENIRYKDKTAVTIAPDAVIGDFCYIGAEVEIRSGAKIYPHVFIDDRVVIGENAVVYPRAVLMKNVRLGRGVIIHAGAVIGDDGFGFNQVFDPEKNRMLHLKNFHAGGVVIEDYVEVGSQVCIDQGLAAPTVVGTGTKIDNLAQIAHNVRIGRDCIIVAQVGLAGHARLEDQVVLFGQVGVGDGVTIGEGAIVIGRAGVTADLPQGRTAWAGLPARKADEEWKHTAIARRELPRLREFFRQLKKVNSFQELQAAFGRKGKSGQREDQGT